MNATRPSESTQKICRTRINIGMKLVSCAANVASRWWINNLDLKWKKSIVEIATTLSLLLDAMDVEIYSAQEQKRWNTRPDSGMRNVSVAWCASRPLGPRALYPGNRKSTAPLATRKSSRLVASNVTR